MQFVAYDNLKLVLGGGGGGDSGGGSGGGGGGGGSGRDSGGGGGGGSNASGLGSAELAVASVCSKVVATNPNLNPNPKP